jgi:cell wall-associated NlpC family hydrolase
MTTICTTPARRIGLLRRATVAIGLALGITATTLPAQEAAAGTLSYTIGGATVTAPSWGAKVAVWTALAQRGDPYVWGGSGPSSFDCSGLTSYSWARAGITIPRTSSAQSTYGRAVSSSELRAGDLVFFYSPVSHVAMYIGNGYIVHAPTSGDVVRVTKLAYMSSYAWARRPY